MNGFDGTALDRLRRARGISDAEEARELYARWAEHYDDDVYRALRVTGSNQVSGLLKAHCPPSPDLAVLDAGCGTGMLGSLLHGIGYRLIDGIDISPEMLAIARRKQVYRHLQEADINQSFSAPEPSYDAIVSAGTFVHGHVGAEGFRRLFAHLKTEGVMACSISMTVWQSEAIPGLIAALPADTLGNTIEAVIPGQPPDTHMLVLRRRS
jgi:predicted TPR repeat methyltransferase